MGIPTMALMVLKNIFSLLVVLSDTLIRSRGSFLLIIINQDLLLNLCYADFFSFLCRHLFTHLILTSILIC